MCLALPMRVVSREEDCGVAESGGVSREINFMLLPEANVGDYVIVHAGFAIQKLNKEEARKTLQLFAQMNGFAASERD
jgi:hydrogenase expression/formation protein HypC